MTMAIENLVERYGAVEQQVRREMECYCRPFCSTCNTVCCRSHFCMETGESVFLHLVAERFSPGSVCHPSQGWLSTDGCTLVAGRPPVCYEYLCSRISNSLEVDSNRRQALI